MLFQATFMPLGSLSILCKGQIVLEFFYIDLIRHEKYFPVLPEFQAFS